LHELQEELESKVDEYWKLHFHAIAGDVRTRFKYRSVNSESFGLTDEDVLEMDDRQLNMIAPMNSYASFLSREENQQDRLRAVSRLRNVRLVDSSRSSRRYGKDVAKTQVFDSLFTEEDARNVSKRLREGPLADQAGDRNAKKKRREIAS
jgi:protein KRI1